MSTNTVPSEPSSFRRLSRLVLRVIVALLLAAAGLLVFPPTFRALAGLLIRYEARARGADFSVREITGSVFEPLTFQDVRATRTSPALVGTEVRIGRAVAAVSLPNMLLDGGRPWLSRLSLDDVDINVRIGGEKPGQPAGISHIKPPPLIGRLIPSSIDARRVNCTFTRNDDSLRIEGMSLSAGDLGAGRVEIERVRVAHPLLTREFRHVEGRAALEEGRVEIADLRLDEGFVFRNIIAPLTGWSAGVARVEFNAKAFTGELRGNLATVLDNSSLRIEATATFNNISIAPLAAFLGSKAPAAGLIREGKITYQGLPHEMEKASVSTRLEAVDFRWGGRQWDELVVGATFVNRRVQIPEFTLRQARNTLTAHGEMTLPARGEPWWKPDFSVNLDADVRDLSALSALAGPGLADASGEMRALGALRCESGGYSGQFDVSGTGLSYRKAPVQSLRAALSLNGTEMQIQQIELLNGADFVRGKGFVDLASAHNYAGELHLSVADMKTYSPLLGPPLLRHAPGGGMLLDWAGDGARAAHSGSFKLQLKKLRPSDSPAGESALDASAEGTYSPGNVFLSRCDAARNGQRASAKVSISPESVHLENLLVQLAPDAALKGEALLPLDIWSKWPEARLLPEGALKLRLDGTGLPLGSVNLMLTYVLPLDGDLDLHIDAAGTVLKLTGTGSATLTHASYEQGPRFSANMTLDGDAVHLNATALPLRPLAGVSATVDLDAALSQPLAAARVSGTMRLVSLQSQARIPLDTLLETDTEIPIKPMGISRWPFAAWSLDIECAAIVPQQITGQPGTVETALRVSGTAREPQLSGKLFLQGVELASPNATMKLESALLVWPQSGESGPVLVDATASGNAGTLKITARASGTTTKRTLDLESDPPLSSAEILARLHGASAPTFDAAPLELGLPAQPAPQSPPPAR